MNPDTFTTWGVPALVLVVGAALGWALTRTTDEDDEAARHTADARRNDLLTEKATALAALRDLESERSRMSDEAYAAERDKLIARGAAAMRALEEGTPEAPAGPKLSDELQVALAREVERLGAPTVDRLLRRQLSAPAASGPPSSMLAWAALGLLVVGGLVGVMQQNVGSRGAGPMTGRSAGDAPMTSEADRQRAHWTGVLEQNPGNLEALNRLTELELAERRLEDAMRWNQQAIGAAPDDPEARAHHALLSFSVGSADAAFAELDAIVEAHPDYSRAWTYKGLISVQARKFDDAVVALERAVALQPDNSFLAQQLAMARQAASGGMSAPSTSAPAERLATITLSVADGLELSGSETVFLTMKNPSRPGPPLGAKRLTVADLPATLELTTADLLPMAGRMGGVPDPFVIEARVDADGNASTRDVLAEGRLDTVAKGAEGLELSLK